tara:strand:- start:896 stop:1135 length:240 start_codon:yes stop_codon:yes gene_type:complete
MISPFHGEFFTKHKEERNKKSQSISSHYAVIPWLLLAIISDACEKIAHNFGASLICYISHFQYTCYLKEKKDTDKIDSF